MNRIIGRKFSCGVDKSKAYKKRTVRIPIPVKERRRGCGAGNEQAASWTGDGVAKRKELPKT